MISPSIEQKDATVLSYFVFIVVKLNSVLKLITTTCAAAKLITENLRAKDLE